MRKEAMEGEERDAMEELNTFNDELDEEMRRFEMNPELNDARFEKSEVFIQLIVAEDAKISGVLLQAKSIEDNFPKKISVKLLRMY